MDFFEALIVGGLWLGTFLTVIFFILGICIILNGIDEHKNEKILVGILVCFITYIGFVFCVWYGIDTYWMSFLVF